MELIVPGRIDERSHITQICFSWHHISIGPLLKLCRIQNLIGVSSRTVDCGNMKNCKLPATETNWNEKDSHNRTVLPVLELSFWWRFSVSIKMFSFVLRQIWWSTVCRYLQQPPELTAFHRLKCTRVSALQFSSMSLRMSSVMQECSSYDINAELIVRK